MKNMQHTILASAALTACLMLTTAVFAGNPDRAGSAGAGQLLINPWAASNGMAGTDMAITNGLEGTFLNAAGLAFINQNELRFANPNTSPVRASRSTPSASARRWVTEVYSV